MAYSVANLAKIKSSNRVHSFQHASDALENGFVVFKGDLVSNQKEIYTATKPATASLATESAYIIKAPEIVYDQSTSANLQLGKFRTEAGVPARGYELVKGDIIEVSYAGLTLLDTDATVGNHLICANASYKLTEDATAVATLLSSNKFVAKILEVKTMGTLQYVGSNGATGNQYKMVVAEVVQN